MIKNKPEPVQKDAQERAWAVESVLVKKDNYTPILTLYGQTITESDIQLTSTIEADVIKRHVKLGDSVKEGQILLTLDKSRFEQFKQQRLADLNEIEAMITNEKHQFETDQSLLAQESALLKIAKNSVIRAKTLEKSAMASSSQLDDAKRTELQQKLAITRLKANISNHPTRLA
ncbi:MAG: biotin/lipoyl-binding protein, partial [Gammaproteobacteria bacterium]|nr:biotin/lipoyl-binding protein [Gammaproteobacteria bacterium]